MIILAVFKKCQLLHSNQSLMVVSWPTCYLARKYYNSDKEKRYMTELESSVIHLKAGTSVVITAEPTITIEPEHPFGYLPSEEREQCLEAWGDFIMANAEELTQLLSSDTSDFFADNSKALASFVDSFSRLGIDTHTVEKATEDTLKSNPRNPADPLYIHNLSRITGNFIASLAENMPQT